MLLSPCPASPCPSLWTLGREWVDVARGQLTCPAARSCGPGVREGGRTGPEGFGLSLGGLVCSRVGQGVDRSTGGHRAVG